MIRKKIFTNTLFNSGGKLLSFFLQIFIITYLIRKLGKESYGIIVLVLALVGNTNLLEAGFGLSVTKYVAEFKARNDWKGILEVVNTNFVVSTIIAFVFCSTLLIINEFLLDKIFTIPADLLIATKNLIRIFIVLSVIDIWSVSIVRVAEGFQRYAFARLMELVKWLLRFIFIVLAIEKGYGLIGVGIAYFVAGIINLVILYLLVFVHDSNLRLSIRFINKKSFKLLFGFSIWILLSKVFAFLSYRIDTILIGIFLPPVNLAYYSVAFKVYEALRFGFALISSTLIPVSSELNTAADKKKLALLFKKASKYTVMLMYPMFVFVFFYTDKILNFWVGKNFGASVLLTQLFIASLFFGTLVSSGTEIMVGLNKVKKLTLYAAIGSVLNLIISIILIKKIGLHGVVVGTIIGAVIIAVGYLYQMLTEFSISFFEFSKDIVFKPAIASIIVGAIFFIVYNNFYAGVIVVTLYFIFMIAFMVDEDDKKTFLKVFNFKERWLS